MKNLKHCLLALVCLSLPVTALAELEELENKTIKIAEEPSEELIPETQWYLILNSYWGGYFWDRGAGNELYMTNGSDVVYDGMSTKYAAEYLVRFISVEPDAGDPHDKYYFQFGTGNYIWWTWSFFAANYTYSTMAEANAAYVYWIADTPGHLAINAPGDAYCYIDTWGPGDEIIAYFPGEVVSIGGSSDWRLVPVTFEDVSDYDTALSDLEFAYLEYSGYYDSFPAGTTYGCYDEEAVAAFQAALDAAAALLDDPEALADTEPEKLTQMAQDIVDTYEAVLKAYISLAMDVAEGYYFFNSGLDFYENDEGGNPVYVTKGMYSEEESSGTIYAKWKTTDYTCPFLWKVTSKGDKTYEVVNMATDATFDNVSTSTSVTMTVGGENLMVFDAGTDEMEGYAFIRVSTQSENNYYYLHCNGHSNGAGSANYIVGWSNSAPSSWNLVAVSDEEAQAIIDEYAPIKESKHRYELAQEMIEDAQTKMQIAEDAYVGSTKLITSVDQLSSPYTEPTEGSLEALIDEDASTFWHSNWSDGSVATGTHYLQVELNATYDELVFVMTRRSSNNDHITQWGVYGAPSADASKGDCTFLAEISTPFGSSGETLTSSPFSTGGFTTLRFYIDDTTGEGSGSLGFGHMAEFQLYEYMENDISQKKVLGDIYTNLEDIIAVAVAEGQDITEETYNTLKAAYEAFIAAFVDPTELRNTLQEANGATAGMLIGNNPGCWSDTSSASALATTIAEATAYDAACVYTQAQSDAYVAALQEQMATILDGANKVQTDRWYRIRYAKLEEIEANGWDASKGAATSTDESLYGKYMVVANFEQDANSVTIIEQLTEVDLDDICPGQFIFFDDDVDIRYEDYSKFRFINVGDTAYMIQNKATGLFFRAAGTSGYVTLDVHPSLFTISALGYGENLISSWFVDGSSENNLHAQLAYNALVTWSTNTVGSNSGLYIEDIGETVASDYDGTSFNMSIGLGAIYTLCYPVSITANEGTVYGVSVDGNTVTLSPMTDNTAVAGQPFVYINGDIEDYDVTMEEDILPFSHGYDVVSKAQATGQFVGTFYWLTVTAGNVILSGNDFKVVTSTASVYANNAYISGEYSAGEEFTIEFGKEDFDSVESAIATVAQEGNIYSIDGKLLGKGSLNTVKALGKGIYIVNGVKVAVK